MAGNNCNGIVCKESRAQSEKIRQGACAEIMAQRRDRINYRRGLSRRDAWKTEEKNVKSPRKCDDYDRLGLSNHFGAASN